MPRSLLTRWGTWLGLGAGVLAAVGLLLVRVNASLDAEMSLALANERVHIEKITTVRRGARSTHVALLERWLSPISEHATRQARIEKRVAFVRNASDEFAALKRVSAAEDVARAKLVVAVAIWSNRVQQALVAADGPAAVGELRACLDSIDEASDSVLAIDEAAGASSDEHVIVLHRAQAVAQAGFVIIAAFILALAAVGWRRYVAAERGRRDQERTARLRAQFFANMSHELRTPLIAIRGYATLVEEMAPADQALRDTGRSIDREAHDLLEMINNILDASKLEAGKVQLRLEDAMLAPIVERCADRSQVLIGSKPVTLSVDVPNDLPAIRVDVVKLQQVITNLLANAVKFTESGAVRVRARDGNGGTVVIEVEDTGIGIRAEALDRVWKPFEQDDSGTTRRYAGTGLGLAIVRSIVGLLGGEVRIRSKLGKGTCVTVVLPTAAGDTSPAPRTTVRAVHG